MFPFTKSLRPLICCLLPLLLAVAGGCARVPLDAPGASALFIPPIPDGSQSSTTPLFLVENNNQEFNRIGTPRAIPHAQNTEPVTIVDPSKATTYHERFTFSTPQGTYTNEVYRIHFKEVPLDWDMINLTGGKNPGLLIIYTLNEEQVPVLITTVHTCGCYLAFLPTTALPNDAYPADWPKQYQWIYGYSLPSLLPAPGAGERYGFTLADQTHRIAGIELLPVDQPLPDMERVETALASLRDLYRLPYQATTVSFFETEGPRAGYVKNNSKPLERIFLGWLALDFRVGEDKAYLGGDTSSAPLYTSLKFWAREESDLKNFPRFLTYWGWNL